MKRTNEFRMSLDMENVRMHITLYNGFFNLDGAQSSIHSHNSYEFHITLEGCARLKTEEGRFSLEQAEGCIIAPNILHSCIMGEKQSVKSSFCFSFERIGAKTENGLYEVFSDAFGTIDGVKKLEQAGHYITRLKQIMSEFYSDTPLIQLKLRLYFFLLMLSIAESLLPEDKGAFTPAQEEKPSGAEKNIRRLMMEEYIHQNYDKNLSLGELAQMVFLSIKQTARVFEQEFGMGFKAFVLKYRLETSVYYLCSTDLPVNEIAAKVGYQSYNGFYKLFVLHMGQTPGEYRKKHGGGF